MSDTAKLGIREQRILDFVQQRTGLFIREVQRSHAVAAIDRAMQQAGVTNPTDYVARLERDLTALDELIVELVVGETYFFRFPEQFQFLTETILPEITSRVDRQATLRCWSAGCATGEEAYSLAIVLREAGLLQRSHVLATDISKTAIEQARRAIYRDWALRGDGRRRVEPYATQRDGSHQLTSEICQAVHFAHVNLALDVYPSLVTGTGHQDVIFCRNVLIYLDPATIPQVASRLFDSLAAGGWLITAASDPLLDEFAPFEIVEAAGGVYYRRPLETIADWPPRSEDNTASVDVAPARRSAASDEPAPFGAALQLAREALSEGDYRRAAELTANCTHDETAGCLHVKALANIDTDLAQSACHDVLARHSLSVELHYLRAVLLMEQRRDPQALEMIRRLLYLDRSLVIGHLTLGTLLRRAGDVAGAFRSFRNARDLCASQDETRPVPLAEEETFGSLHRAAVAQLASLDTASLDSASLKTASLKTASDRTSAETRR